MTEILSLQIFCCDKIMFVATSLLLSRQKICRGKHTFASTKDVFYIILVAAPANNTPIPPSPFPSHSVIHKTDVKLQALVYGEALSVK